ncbi:hypothetical protein HK103_001273 [Boothiomyces macroporosus]|uniref:FAD-binding domain-containing protein n=1 Tax=Boothiomyces macroporosus TaxID=261099 RepID=A0AAD5UEF4_9FUNG|nr:hypothetical protein HK103_001271 [Boothiomyces macroporosus]KAJ3252773.1 hypothetical protein HK103_001273 [Boothiomyces macroporosus]
MEHKSYKCMIVGAGTTGLLCAAEFVRQGVPVSDFVIIDSLKEPHRLARGCSLSPGTIEVLELYGDVAQQVLENAIHWSNIDFYSEGQPIVKLQNSDELAKYSKYSYYCSIDQWKTEYFLTKFLADNGVYVARDISVVQVHDIGDRVQVKLSNEEIVEVDYLIGADGGKSAVRKQMGIDLKGTSLPNGSVYFHCTTEYNHNSTDTLKYFLSNDGLSYFIPLPNDSYCGVIDLTENEEYDYISKDDQNELLPIPDKAIENLIHERMFPGFEFKEVLYTSRFRAHYLLAQQYWNGNRVFLAGDACHMTSPAHGLGLNYGIHDALNLGWKLSMVMKGLAGPKLLNTYDEERHREGEILVKRTLEMQQTFDVKSDFGKAVRNTILKYVAPMLPKEQTKFAAVLNTRYLGSLTVENSGWLSYLYPGKKLLAGDRIPSTLYPTFDSRCNGPSYGYTVLVFCSGKIPFILLDVLKTTKLVSAILYGNETNASQFGVGREAIFLVRPDGFIGYRADSFQIEPCLKYLKANAQSLH